LWRHYSRGQCCLPELDVGLRGEENGGSSSNIGVAFPVKGGGWGPGSGLFPWAGHNSCGEVGVPNWRCEARLKKKNGVKTSSPRARLGE